MDDTVEHLVEYEPASPNGTTRPVFGDDEDVPSDLRTELSNLFRKENLKPAMVLLLFIATGTVETVDYSVNGKKFMFNYLTILNLLVVAVATVFFGLVVLVQHKRGYYEEAGGVLKELKASPKWFFGNISAMALCDTFALYMAILASREVTAPLRNMLQQGNIPITMALSRLFLGHRYCWSHFIGAALIIAGIALVIWQIADDNSGLNNHDHSNTGWSFAFFLSCIPMSVSICLKEHVLNHPAHPVDMHLVNASVACFQFVLGLLLAPCGYMVSSQSSSVHGLWSNLADGLRCALSGQGCNSQCGDIRRNTNNGVCDLPASGDDCGLEYAPITVWLYIAVCCLFNMLMLWVISNNTAVLYFVALAAIIPVVSLVSTSGVYSSVGLCTVAFSALQIVGLVTTVLGIVVYRLQSDEEIVESWAEETETACVYSHQSIADTIREMSGLPKEDEEASRSSGFRSLESTGVGGQRVRVGSSPIAVDPGAWDHHARDLERGKDRAARKHQASCS